MYQRFLQLSGIIEKKSIFFLGPRQTGKSTLLREQLPNARFYNLLDMGLFKTLSNDLTLIRREVLAMNPSPSVVVIDEVQRLPEILNEVHLLIEEHGIRFALTGSSARALKRKGVNLLGGRARSIYFHPLVSCEVGVGFDLMRALNHGLIPSMYDSNDAENDLRDYAGIYLREEVAAEGLTRNIPAFSRFLEVAALSNGKIINYTKIAGDSAIKRTTLIDYFGILYDTLLAFELPAWRKSKKRKAITSSKFYLFDPGVARSLAGLPFHAQKSPAFGEAFEHLIFHELNSALDYGCLSGELNYWRSTSGFEVDFLIDGRIAIEVKASSNIAQGDGKGLLALKEEIGDLKMILVALIDQPQIRNGIEILPWRDFLRKLWHREYR